VGLEEREGRTGGGGVDWGVTAGVAVEARGGGEG
jgi:hypothetical protein